MEGEWRGRPLNRCARLRDTAAGGQIVASHATTELVGDDLAGQAVITDLGEQHLRGVTRTERAHQIQARPAPTEPGASGGRRGRLRRAVRAAAGGRRLEWWREGRRPAAARGRAPA